MKTWVLSAVASALLLAGCGGQKPSTVNANAPAAKAEPRDSTMVTLDEAAQKEAGIGLVKVTAGSLPETIKVTGRMVLNENRTWRVGAVTDGRIVKTTVNVGDAIQHDQVLARMHSHDVHEGRALYQRAKSELSRAKSNEAQARRVRDRSKRLYDLKAASLEQVEHSENEFKNAQAMVAQAEIELQRTSTHLIDFLGVKLDEPEHHAVGAHDENDEADLIPVKAPASGTLMDRKVTTGTVVEPGGEMFVISDLGALWMVAAVPEEHLARLRIGMNVNVRVQAHPGRVFHGKVTRLGEQLDAATRTVQARIELPNPQGLLKPEMYGDVELVLPGKRSALFIPELAVQEVKGATTVFVQRAPNQYQAQAIEPGGTANGMLEVIGGLKEGESVVVQGAFTLKSQLLKSSLTEE